MMYRIDINCDMGEFDCAEACQKDLAFMPYISRCNIAVGGHIGNADTIKTSFENAHRHNLFIGIHPSYPDKQGFGRDRNNLSTAQVISSLREQIELGLSIATGLRIDLSHIKCHGALYNDLEQSTTLSLAVADLFSQYPLAVMGMANGQFAEHCEQKGRPFIREAFMDRRYLDANHLQSRTEEGAVFNDINTVVNQAVAIAKGEVINTLSGDSTVISADSLCVHSDTKGALELLKEVRKQFKLDNIDVEQRL